jgi:hypothetical protein
VPHVDLRGEVEHDVGALVGHDQRDLGDVQHVQRHAVRHVLPATGREVVDDGDRVAASQQRVD